jgi:cob(I)alamin adenosyltransferase
MKIYTKTGDGGGTSLFGGTKISKDDIQIEAYGTVDELNSFLGVLISNVSEKELQTELKAIQPILFDIGSHLASDGKMPEYLPPLDKAKTADLESSIDRMTNDLPPLKSFIMPGGNPRIADAHVCRVVCRRAERRVVSMVKTHSDLNPFIQIYLNRLSDYFFVVARYIAHIDGIDEVKWNPKS